jgi:hypothetical protein
MTLLRCALALVLCGKLQALTPEELQGFIHEASKAGGGEVVIPPGTHILPQGLLMENAAKVRLIGLDAETCILKLPPVAYAELAENASAEADRLVLGKQRGLVKGMKLILPAEGDDQFIEIKSIESGVVVLVSPLKSALPAKTWLKAQAGSLLTLRGNCEGLSIEKLTLDGGRTPADPTFAESGDNGLVQASGTEKARLNRIALSRCIVQNTHGSGVIWKAVEGSIIEDCTFMDIAGPAIVLGPLTRKCLVRHNLFSRALKCVLLLEAAECEMTANERHDCVSGLVIIEGAGEKHRVADSGL